MAGPLGPGLFFESARSWFLADRDQFLYQCLHLYKHGTFNAVLARQARPRGNSFSNC